MKHTIETRLFRIRLFPVGFSVAFGKGKLKVLSLQIVAREQSRWRGIHKADIWENATIIHVGRIYGIYFN